MEITIEDLYNQGQETQKLVRQNEKHLATLNGTVSSNVKDIAEARALQAADHDCLTRLEGRVTTIEKVTDLRDDFQQGELKEAKGEAKGADEWMRDQLWTMAWKLALVVGTVSVLTTLLGGVVMYLISQ